MSQDPASSSAQSKTKPTHSSQRRSRPQVLLGMLRQLGGIALAFVPLLWQTCLKLLKWLSKQWLLLLPKIRAVLPARLRTLPDWLITAAAVLLLVLLLSIPATLNRSPAVASPPASSVLPEAPTETPAAPKPNRNTARLTKLQAQISEAVTQQAEPYGADLVQSVQADFELQQLTVGLSDRWYGLTGEQQNRIAELLLKQAKKQRLGEIEIVDPQGITLARPAVVGSGMVVLVRT